MQCHLKATAVKGLVLVRFPGGVHLGVVHVDEDAGNSWSISDTIKLIQSRIVYNSRAIHGTNLSSRYVTNGQ